VIDHGENGLAESDPDPALVELTEQITDRLQAGDEIDVQDYVRRYPQWAVAILKLLPTMHDLVDYGRSVDRDRWHRRQRVSPNAINKPKP
jgi:hypothetical protein